MTDANDNVERAEAWNRAYSTALREFAALTEAMLAKNPETTVQMVIDGMRTYAEAIYPTGAEEPESNTEPKVQDTEEWCMEADCNCGCEPCKVFEHSECERRSLR